MTYWSRVIVSVVTLRWPRSDPVSWGGGEGGGDWRKLMCWPLVVGDYDAAERSDTRHSSHWQSTQHRHVAVDRAMDRLTDLRSSDPLLFLPAPLRQLRCIWRSLTTDAWQTLATAFIANWVGYCNAVLYGTSTVVIRQLQMVLNAAARLVVGLSKYEHITPALRNVLH